MLLGRGDAEIGAAMQNGLGSKEPLNCFSAWVRTSLMVAVISATGN